MGENVEKILISIGLGLFILGLVVGAVSTVLVIKCGTTYEIKIEKK